MARIYPVTMPKLGLEMSEGMVAGWHVPVGGLVEVGQELVDIETDKITNVLDIPVSGVLRRILVEAGQTVAVGALIGIVADPEVPEAEIDRFVAAFRPVDASFEPKGEKKASAAPAAGGQKPSPAPLETAAAGNSEGTRTLSADQRQDDTTHAPHAPQTEPAPLVSPIAVKFAEAIGLSLEGLVGTGRKGRISLADAQKAAIERGLWQKPSRPQRETTDAPAAPPAHPPRRLPFPPMRKAIARSVVLAKTTIPHFYTEIDVRLDALLALQASLDEASERKISLNACLLKAAALAARHVPDINLHVEGEAALAYEQVDLGFAVAVKGGILTPVVRAADRISLTELAAEIARLIDAARARRLTAEEVTGATFTVSNMGMFGVRNFAAIIVPPQAAILSLGTSRREAREGQNGTVGFGSILTATLSADHRVIDGASAAEYLNVFRTLVEKPLSLLL